MPLALAAVRVKLSFLAAVAAVCLTACGGGSHASAGTTAGGATAGKPKHAKATHHATAPRPTPALIPPANAPLRSVTVPVLTYHRVHTLPAVGQLDLIVDPATFA